jgi:uncharacterized membrane protein
METRPKIKAEPTTADKWIEFAGWLAFLLLWLITLFHYSKLPETIPVHFNVTGTADGFGGKSTIFMLPVLGTVLFIGITILNRYPHVFNYPVKITPENALKQYTMAQRLLRVLKFSVIVIFTLISWFTARAAIENSERITAWLTPLMMALVFIPMGYYIFKSFSNK